MSETYFHLPSLYALIIGINNYISPQYPNLQSAAKDADDICTYLTSRLKVPYNNIINLRNEAATRTRILEAFNELRALIPQRRGEAEVAIVIYFGGHGTRCEKPVGWVDWAIVGDYVEAICPSDVGTVNNQWYPYEPGTRRGSGTEEDLIPPIPDRTLAALINRLSETKGNNITLILDCCHSAGANRNDEGPTPEKEGFVPRRIEDPPSLPPRCDNAIVGTFSRGMTTTQGYSGRNHSSHVLLAACGRHQAAYEHHDQPNGVFTFSLLKVLNQHNVEDLTYTSLMHRLDMPPWQNAHCEGAAIHKRLFHHKIPGSDKSFILGSKRGRMMKLEAGTIHGISVGSKFAVHASNLVSLPQQPNQPIGTLVASSVEAFSSQLEFPPDTKPFQLHTMFYCRLIERPSESLTISSPDLEWLDSVLPAEFRLSHSLEIVNDTSLANFVLTPEGETVYIDHHFPMAAEHIGTRSPFKIPKSDTGLLREVVRCAINFRYHLLRTNPAIPSINVSMQMTELEMSYNEEFELSGKPIGGNIFEGDLATVTIGPDGNKRYGAIIDNHTDLRLYTHLFYFDPSEFSITPWYLPPTGTGTGTSSSELHVDVVLPPKAEFPIGYGESGIDPWEFWMPEGMTKDVGFFKLYLTTVPTNFRSIAQDCPFRAASARAGQPQPAERPAVDFWASICKTVVQVKAEV